MFLSIPDRTIRTGRLNESRQHLLYELRAAGALLYRSVSKVCASQPEKPST